MLVENVKVNVRGMEIEVSKGTTLLEISKMFNSEGRKPIIAKIINIIRFLIQVAIRILNIIL